MSQRRNNRGSRGNTSIVANTTIQEVDPSLDGAIKECVRYFVCREGSKIPMKRAELMKHLSTTNQTPPNQVNVAIVEANKVLKRIYGYKIVQVEAKSGIQYILVLDQECDSPLSSAVDLHQRRLLVATLTHIFMSGGSVKEDEMWKFLSEAGLLEENDHSGRKILITTFVRQMYLMYTKVGEGDLARNVFEWGQRAVEEMPKINILKKMAEAFEKAPDHWCEQYRDATETVAT